MNERIRGLWIKAAESTAAFPSGQNNSWETQVNFLHKFAELIVKECAKIADIESPKEIGCGYITYTKGERIKQHFGVEE